MEIYCGFATLIAAEQHVATLHDISRSTRTGQLRDERSTSQVKVVVMDRRDLDGGDLSSQLGHISGVQAK